MSDIKSNIFESAAWGNSTHSPTSERELIRQIPDLKHGWYRELSLVNPGISDLILWKTEASDADEL